MGLEAMTKTEMLEILRGKVLQESPEEIQARLNEIADELEQSERVVRCMDCKWGHDESLRFTMSDRDDWFWMTENGWTSILTTSAKGG